MPRAAARLADPAACGGIFGAGRDQRDLGGARQPGPRRQWLVVHTVEVENQIKHRVCWKSAAPKVRRAAISSPSEPRFFFWPTIDTAVASIVPDVDKLIKLTSDNPVQTKLANRLRSAVGERLAEFAKAVDFVKRNDTAGGVAMLRDPGAGASVQAISEASAAMFVEETRLFRAAHGESRPQPRFWRLR